MEHSNEQERINTAQNIIYILSDSSSSSPSDDLSEILSYYSSDSGIKQEPVESSPESLSLRSQITI